MPSAVTDNSVSTPKQTLHSFAFPTDSSGRQDVLVVGKDGTLSIGPITESPVVSPSPSA